jgi:hypothetical protein
MLRQCPPIAPGKPEAGEEGDCDFIAIFILENISFGL